MMPSSVPQENSSPRPNLSMQDASPRIAAKNREKILESVLNNRVTIVVGATGSGKSTLIPPLLLDGLPFSKPVLCTQPRRLAVVAIAKRLSETRGREVGYHVGNQNLSSKHTRLLFTTAGILLEDLRANGVSTLTKYGCIIIDECHERSPESDLVLALCKQFMKSNLREEIRLVLMSASFDSQRYKQFFSSVCPSVDIIALETAQAFAAYYNQVQEFYLEDILQKLPQADIAKTLMRPFLKDPNQDLQFQKGKELSPNILFLMVVLIEWLHERENQDAPFLIFAPTYRHLEQLHTNLEKLPNLQLHVLHSSVDMEDCLRSMMPGLHTNKRRVLLASAIADSSITIPGVSCVIDMCRALDVRWHPETKSYVPSTVWASRSICQQRRGRTGRTCAGQVFRLVPKGFFSDKLEPWDIPQLMLSSCHNEVLSIITAKSKINVRTLLLDACMDQPDEDIVDDAIDYLKDLGACVQKKMRLAPSPYGMLLAALPLDVRDSTMVLAGAQMGLLYETLALCAIHNHKPSPIVHYFGEQKRNEFNMIRYYPHFEPENPTSSTLAHLSAYMYWDAEWNSKIRLERAKKDFQNVAGSPSATDESRWQWTEALEEEHADWCREHEINPTAVRSVAELFENSVHIFYKAQFEPTWLRCFNPTPSWKRAGDWKGDVKHGWDMFQKVYARRDLLCKALTHLCQCKLDKALYNACCMLDLPPPFKAKGSTGPLACIHFLAGNCKYGNRCRAAHSYQAKRPLCRFFQQGVCNKGKSCLYSHEKQKASSMKIGSGSAMDAVIPVLSNLFLPFGPADWFRKQGRELMLLGEGDFKFTLALSKLNIAPAIASSNATHVPSELRTKGLWDQVDATRLHLNSKIPQHLGALRSFAWNFPWKGSTLDEDPSPHEMLLCETFLSLSLLLETAHRYFGVEEYTFAITMQGDQFSRWSVLRSAWRTGWQLTSWSAFDPSHFPGYRPSRHHGEAFPADNPRFYVFSRKGRIG